MEDEFDIICLIKYFWKRKAIILYISLSVFVIANIIFFVFNGLVYSNTAKIKIFGESSNNIITLYKDLLLSDEVVESAIDNSKLNVNKENVKSNLSITADNGSDVYTITLNYNSKEKGRELCNSIINVFINRLENYNGTSAIVYNHVTSSDKPINFSIIKNELLYFGIGCFLSLGYMFVVYYLDKKIKNKTELVNYNVLGVIDGLNNNNIGLIKAKIKLSNTGSVIFFNTARNIDCKEDVLSIVKEFSKDSEVLFIDADIRNNKSKSLGYYDLLKKYKGDCSKYIKSNEKFDYIESGTNVDNVDVLLSSKCNEKLINDLRDKYDYIIIYNANVIDYSDSLILSKLCDCNYMIVQVNKTKKSDFEESLKYYNQINQEVNGIIIIDKE